MLVIKLQLQHKGGEDVSSFVTMCPGTLTYFKMENRMPGMNTTWAHEKRYHVGPVINPLNNSTTSLQMIKHRFFY